MATAETETSRNERVPPGGLIYDGFISYSHAADDLLAPRLQAGLQRFAKPWWKRRALRIFRDESSLSANPHLWSSITDALDQSTWFVLLLSPDAAESQWVNQEIEYWLEHKDASRIIPVVTDGEFRWAETDIDLESTAAPPALYGAFSDEPRWVDLRFARSEEQLDLNNPRFSAAVADVASAIRQVPKDELESEEVLQHRRTVRTAWAAGFALLLFAVLAAAAAIFAFDQRNDAQAATAAETEQRQVAEENAAEAEQQREAALAAQAEAEQQAEIARARELTLEAEKALESDPELSAHLALTALAALQEAGADSAQAVSAVRAAVASDRVTFRVPGGDAIAVHPDGALLAVGDEDGGVTVWDIASRQIVERYHREDARPGSAAFSPDGNLLAVGFISEDATTPNVTIWDRTSGESDDIGPVVVVEAYDLVFSHGGRFLAFTGFDPASETPDSMVVWAVDEQEVLIDTHGWGPDFSGEDALAYVTMTEAGEPIVVTIDPVSGDAIHQVLPGFLPFWATWSPDGTRIAAAEVTTVVVFDLESGEEIARPEVDRVRRPVWLTNDTFMIGGESIPKVVDAWTGEVLMTLPGQAGGTGEYVVVPGRAAVASAGMLDSGSGAVIFDTSPVGGYEVAGWSSPLATNFKAGYVGDGSRVIIEDGDSHVTANARDGADADVVPGTGVRFAGGAPVGALWIADTDPAGNFVYHGTPDGSWVLRSLATDEVLYRAPPGWSIRGTNSDGTQVVIKEGVGFCGPFRLVSTQDDSANDLALQCAALFAFSPDGEMVAALSAGEFGLAFFDTASGEPLADLTGTGYTAFGGGFTPNGSKLVVGSHDGLLYVLDIEVLLSGGPIEEVIVLEREAHDTLVTRVVVSPDGTMATTSAAAEPLRLWDLDTGELVGEFGLGVFAGLHLGDFHPILNHLMVTTPPNVVRIHTLDVDELVAIAESRLSRDMTEPECQQYFERPCQAL